MKTKNLPARVRTLALSALILTASFLSLGFLLSGCSSPPAAERFLFDAVTNTVPVVTNWTTVETVTNQAGDSEQVSVVNWRTNIESHVTYTTSTNASAIVGTVGRVTDIFAPGIGELVSIGAGGLLAIWARVRSRKSNLVMAEGTEILLSLLETTHGKQFTDGLKAKLAKDQNTAGVLREISTLVTKLKPDNDYYRMIAKQLLDTLPKSDA